MSARALVAVLGGVLLGLSPAAVTGPANAGGPTTTDETTIGYSAERTNWDAGEPALTTLRAAASTFGTRWDAQLPNTTGATPNQVYAQPLVAGGHVVVATDDNELAAFDPTTGARQWALTNLGPGWTPTPTCGDLSPHIGITSTPVYDAGSRTVYLIAKIANGTATPSLQVHAIDVDTGHEVSGWPHTITGTPSNGGPALNAATSAQRAGLLLGDDHALYFATASHCDNGPFVGYVGRVPLADPAASTLWATVSNGANYGNGQAGIWQSGGGIMSDGDDAHGHPRLFVVTGNGIESAPPRGSGTAVPRQLSESVVHLSVDDSTGRLSAVDFFSPRNNAELDLDDSDLGSGGTAALPNTWGDAGHPHLLVAAGKDGIVRLLDRDDLGGMGQGAGGSDDVVSSVQSQGVWGRPALFDAGDGRRYVYYAPANAAMQAFRLTPDAHGTPTLTRIASTRAVLPFGVGSPVVTSDPADPTTALVWLVSTAADGNGRLTAYPAVPPTGAAWTPIRTIDLGHPVAKFVQPATAGGRVFVGTKDGHVVSIGDATVPPFTAPATDFGTVAVNGTVQRTVKITSSGPTVTGVSTSGPFTAGTATSNGATTTVPVTFRPTAGGPSVGTLRVTGGSGTYAFGLHGTGTVTGFALTPGSLPFGRVAVGQRLAVGVLITNTGAATASVTSVKLTAANGSSAADPEFAITSAVPTNASVGPQAAIAVVVRFAPTTAAARTARLVVSGPAGTHSIAITATGYRGTPRLALSVPGIDFGQVPIGGESISSFKVRNDGDAALHVTKAAQPAAPFFATIPVPEGVDLQPTTSPYSGLYGQVTVRPISAMPHRDHYAISAARVAGGNAPPKGNSPQRLALAVNTRPWTARVVGRFGCIAAQATDARLKPCSAGAAITRTSDGRLHHGSASATSCLSVNGGSRTPGAVVDFAPCSTHTIGQVWRLGAAGTLLDAHSGLCLTVPHVPTASNPVLRIARCGVGETRQQWDVDGLLSTRGLLSSGLGALGVYCLTDRGSSAAAGTAQILHACTFASGQIITHVSGTLRTRGGCLAPTAARRGSPLVLRLCSGAAAQQWRTDSAHRLVNPASRLCLTVLGGKATSGAPIVLATCSSPRAQRWTLPDS